MCDTAVVTADISPTGTTLFFKNSDREANEAQQLVSVPAKSYEIGSTVKCTYIEIPQTARTHALLLSKPYWLWGAEMGVNEHGVAIGNEAVFTKIPYEKKAGLIGMDLLRLGLERGSTAREALETITELLARYGQGGNCKPGKKFSYHNSFIIADPKEAYVLETVGREWAAKKISGVYSISNGLTLGGDFDECSPGLVSLAKQKGICGGREDLNLAKGFSDILYTGLSGCKTRRSRLTSLLNQACSEDWSLSKIFSVLRDHGPDKRHPQKGITGDTVCLHASFGPTRYAQTTGSMVSVLSGPNPLSFVTGTAAPCTGFFKPVWVDTLPDHSRLKPQAQFDASTLFWKHEILHREVLRDFETRTELMARLQAENEARWVREASRELTRQERIEITARIFEESERMEERVIDQLIADDGGFRSGLLFRLEWTRLNKQANIPSELKR